MDSKHLEQARYQLAKAEAALGPIRQAQTLSDMENAWGDFVAAIGTFYNKLHAGAKTAGGGSYSWFGRKIHERKSDGVLNYVNYSRDAHEHGIVELQAAKSVSIRSNHSGPSILNFTIGSDPEKSLREAAAASGGTDTFVSEVMFMCWTAKNKKHKTTCNPPNLEGGFRARLPTPERLATLTLE